MKLLASPMSVREAADLLAAGVDVIDVKNPREGSLGAARPDVAVGIFRLAAEHATPVSVALGDLEHRPGTAAWAACGAASLGAHYVKAGLRGSRTTRLATEMMSAVVAGVRTVCRDTQVVACGYADSQDFNGLGPAELLAAAEAAACDYVMLDTCRKDGRGLFDCLPGDVIADFVAGARDRGLRVALAGSLRSDDLERLWGLRPDMIGVRGAVCGDGDRTGEICRQRAEAFVEQARCLGGC